MLGTHTKSLTRRERKQFWWDKEHMQAPSTHVHSSLARRPTAHRSQDWVAIETAAHIADTT